MPEIDLQNISLSDLPVPVLTVAAALAVSKVGYSFWKSKRRTMSRRKSEKAEKLANGEAEKDTEENSDVDESQEDAEETVRSSKRAKTPKKGKKESSRGSSRKRSASKSLKEESDESDTEYEVEKIVDVKTDKKGKRQFLVKWKGYSSKDNSWEPESNLSCDDLIEDFLADNKVSEPESYQVSKILDVKTDKSGKRTFLVSWKGYSSNDNTWEPESNLSCDDLIEEFLAENKKSPTKKAVKTESPKGKKKKKN